MRDITELLNRIYRAIPLVVTLLVMIWTGGSCAYHEPPKFYTKTHNFAPRDKPVGYVDIYFDKWTDWSFIVKLTRIDNKKHGWLSAITSGMGHLTDTNNYVHYQPLRIGLAPGLHVLLLECGSFREEATVMVSEGRIVPVEVAGRYRNYEPEYRQDGMSSTTKFKMWLTVGDSVPLTDYEEKNELYYTSIPPVLYNYNPMSSGPYDLRSDPADSSH
jgi:hypothetical protein